MRAFVVALALVLAGCAGMSRMNTYPTTLADAKVTVGHRQYSIWFHRSEPTVLIQRGFGAAMGQGVVEGLSLGVIQMNEPQPVWRTAGQTVLTELGCTVSEVYTLDNDITWEARYVCPDATMVSADEVQANRARWRAGLIAADPMAQAAAPAN